MRKGEENEVPQTLGWRSAVVSGNCFKAFMSLLQVLLQGNLNIHFSLTVEVRNTGLATLPACVTIFYNLALYNVVLAIKDLKG